MLFIPAGAPAETHTQSSYHAFTRDTMVLCENVSDFSSISPKNKGRKAQARSPAPDMGHICTTSSAGFRQGTTDWTCSTGPSPS